VFVIVSGDSDFSPLVSKLRENDKRVIGVGVKNSSSRLLIENCDEFLYYDDLVRERKKRAAKSKAPPAKAPKRSKATAEDSRADETRRKQQALEIVVETAEALFRDRASPLWGSHIKQTLKRKRPNFSETFHGYRSFNELLEDADRRNLLKLQKDERSGGYIVVGLGDQAESG
jgi:hypothetical protein